MLSVIIPTCNRNELLSNCLDKLAPGVQFVSPDIYEVIVTDDSKAAAASDLVQQKYTWAKYVKGPKKGPAANRNNGAKYAKGEWLVFIDDDCVPNKNLLSEYLNGIKKNAGCLAFEGAIFPDDEKLLKKDMAECPVNTTGGCFWSANICINERLFNEIGGFDESYLIAAQEDQQLKITIEDVTGNGIMFLEGAKVIHPVRFIGLNKKLINIPLASKNFSLYAFKNRKILGYTSLFKFLKSQVAFHLKNILFTSKRLQFRQMFLGLAWLFFGIPLNLYNFFCCSKLNNN